MKKISNDQFYKPGVQKRDDKMTFILKPFPFGMYSFMRHSTNRSDFNRKSSNHLLCFSDGPSEKEDVLGTSNKKLFEEYSLKKPRLLIWFTDESGRIHRPTPDVTGPALGKFLSVLYHWHIFWFFEASVDCPINMTDPVVSPAQIIFDASRRYQILFSLVVSPMKFDRF